VTPLPSAEVLVADLVRRGVVLPPGDIRVDAYGDTADLSRELLNLIVRGKKRAGTSLLWAVEADDECLPRAGDIEIVVDHRNVPALITRITRVDVVAFDEVDAEYASAEGEGDGSLNHWRRSHWEFFSRECARIGRVPESHMPVVCSFFELLNVVSAA
jgi:uncharacterized protein YhfF